MNKLVNKRTGLIGKIDALKLIVDQHGVTPLDSDHVQLHLAKVKNLSDKNDSLFDDILEISKDAVEIALHQSVYDDQEVKLNAIKMGLRKIEKTFPTAIPIVSTAADIRLPKLELPKFDGNLQQWMTFRDLFIASVHSNSKLSGAQKLQYLMSSLMGEAALVLSSISITDDNYDGAWDTLNNRYQNKREIVKSHLDRLFSQPNIPQESPAALRKLVDTSGECMRALQVLKIPPEQVGDLLAIHILSRKLDPDSRMQWERSLKDKGDILPTFTNFMTELDQHVRVITAANANKAKTPSVKSSGPTNSKATASVNHGNTSAVPQCVVCSSEHSIFKCDDFLKLSVTDRFNVAKKHSLCFNCLSKNHSSSKCKSGSCRTCNRRHHTLLHTPTEESDKAAPAQQPKVETLFSDLSGQVKEVLLSTARVKIVDSHGQLHICRALIDNGSQASIISENCAQRLKLRRRRVTVPLSGLGERAIGTSRDVVNFQLHSCINSFNLNIDALILPKITGNKPNHAIDSSNWTYIKGISLADPEFYKPSQVDILLGSDVYAELILGRKIRGPPGYPIALESEFGWLLSGKILKQPSNSVSIHHTQFDISDLNSALVKFWELEEVPRKSFLTPEEAACEEHFTSTHTRDVTGRYTVCLPFKENSKPLGESRHIAVQRLKQVERRLLSKPDPRYNQVSQEYLDLGHMELVPESELEKEDTYYLPHHAVYKESSSTTKLRVVFDASAATTTGISLNDNLMIGPRLQDDIVSILIRFRVHPVAFSADIAKMYRQFRVHKDHVDFQRIVWRQSPDEGIKDYRLLTATFGTASAPYTAVKCVQQLAKDEEKDFPLAAQVLINDLNVDNLMSGASCAVDAIRLQKDLLQLTKRGQLELRKWSSNSTKFLESLPEDIRETSLTLRIDLDETVKALGLQWNPSSYNTEPEIKSY